MSNTIAKCVLREASTKAKFEFLMEIGKLLGVIETRDEQTFLQGTWQIAKRLDSLAASLGFDWFPIRRFLTVSSNREAVVVHCWINRPLSYGVELNWETWKAKFEPKLKPDEEFTIVRMPWLSNLNWLLDPLEIRGKDYVLCDDLKNYLKAQRVGNQTLIVQHPDIIPIVHCLERKIEPMRSGSKAFIISCLLEWKAAVEWLPDVSKHIPDDGPFPPSFFRRAGDIIPVPQQPWTLLNFMWEKDKAKIKKAIMHLWPATSNSDCSDESSSATYQALKSVMHKLNELTKKKNIHFRLKFKNKCVYVRRDGKHE